MPNSLFMKLMFSESHEPIKTEFSFNSTISRRWLVIALIVLGFTTILSQLIVIREFLNVFQGNELIIGMILSIWMLLTAIGSRLGQQFLSITGSVKITSRLFLMLGILPAIVIFLLYLLERQLFPTGTAKDLVAVFMFCMGLMLPGCLVSGILFTMLASILSGASGKNSVSEAYGWESAGSTVAGILFSLCLAYMLRTFQLLALLTLINLLLYIFLFPKADRKWRFFIMPVILLVVSIFLFISPVDRWIKSFHFKNQELVYTKDTPYGNVAVTLTAGQYNFYENGTFLFSTENQLMHEEAIHFALLQHFNPKKIMIVSGGIKGMVKQALKYRSVRSIDYFEINPWLVRAEERFSTSLSMPLLRTISKDARKWIRKSSGEYDAIIINTPDPSNARINRYYTLEFFREAKHALRTNGVFSVSLSPTVNYMNTDAKKINRVIYQTLKKVFHQVKVIPGERNYFIASDGIIGIDIARRIRHASIENEYVNPYYIDDELLMQYNRQMMDEIAVGSAVVNTDMSPLAYFLQIRYWLSIFHGNSLIMPIILLIPILILFLAVLRKASPVTIGIFTGGFAGASSEFLILIAFQILYGYVYQMLGIIIAFYMIGLTLGTFVGVHNSGSALVRSYTMVQFILLLMVLLIPVIIVSAVRFVIIPEWVIQAFLFTFTAAIAFAAGLEYNMASKLERHKIERVAGNLYAIDLAGAAGGTLLTSLICFPLLGLLNTCLVIVALVTMSITVMVISRKKYS
jgi:spermidine synthase